MKRMMIMILTLTMLALGLTGCAGNVKTFEKYVRAGDYAKAITLYQEKLGDDFEDSRECRRMVEAYLKDSLTGYRQGKLSQDEFEAVLFTMEKLEDYLYLVDNLDYVYCDYVEVRASKESYRQAEELQKAGRLVEALEAYNDVVSLDVENFDKACESVQIMRQKLSENIVDTLTREYKNKNYPAVFTAYRNADKNVYVTMTEEMSAIYEAAILEYTQEASRLAEQAFGGAAKDYNAAMESLHAAKAAVADDPLVIGKLEKMAEEYKAYIPVALSKKQPVSCASYVEVGTYDSDFSTDISGNTYDKESVIRPTGAPLGYVRGEDDSDSYVTYNLNFEYSTFTATIYRPYSFLSYTGAQTPGKCLVKIFGDDVLLYEYYDPFDNWDVVPVNLDVSGVRNLKIIIRGCWDGATGLLEPPKWKPGICLADGMLQK